MDVKNDEYDANDDDYGSFSYSDQSDNDFDLDDDGDADMNEEIFQKSCLYDSNQNEIFLLFHGYDELIMDLHRILSIYYNLSVWPSVNADWLLIDQYERMKKYKLIANDETKTRIKSNKMIICIINNEFIKSQACNELLEYSKNLNKSIILLIVDENAADESLKSRFIESFDLFKDKICKYYDQWLWISETFEKVIEKIGTVLKKKLVNYNTVLF